MLKRPDARVHSVQVLDFLYGSVLVFFVIKIEKIRTQGGDVSGSWAAIRPAAPPLLRAFEPPHSSLSPDPSKLTKLVRENRHV